MLHPLPLTTRTPVGMVVVVIVVVVVLAVAVCLGSIGQETQIHTLARNLNLSSQIQKYTRKHTKPENFALSKTHTLARTWNFRRYKNAHITIARNLKLSSQTEQSKQEAHRRNA